MQVSTLNAELGLISKLVEWFRDATSLPHGHLLINLSPRTDDRLRYCTKTGSIPSQLLIPDRLKQSQFLDDEHKKFLYSPSVPIFFPQMEKYFPSVLPKRVYKVPVRMYSKFSQRELSKHNKILRDKFRKRSSIAHSKRNLLEARKRRSGIRKGLELIKVLTLPVINHLS